MTFARPTFPPTLIDEAALRTAIARLPRFGRSRYAVTVDSTNARALDVIHTLDALGISIVTESQQEGRGRAGRRWASPAGAGVYCTTILPAELENRTLPAVGFWAALAAASAIWKCASLRVELKWPNDLLLAGGAKCCGILGEGRSIGDRNRVAVGVGINVNRPAVEPISEDFGFLSDAAGRAIDRTVLLVQLLAEYEASFDALLDDPAGVIRDWAQLAAIDGKRLAVGSPDGRILHEGVARGIGADGALLLETKGGPVSVRLGDVSALD